MNINEILDKIFEILNGTEDKDSSHLILIERLKIYMLKMKKIFLE